MLHSEGFTITAATAAQPHCISHISSTDLCDGEGLLLGVLAQADHEQHLGGEQQAAGVLLARAAHDGHLQGHVQLRPAQGLQHLPVARPEGGGLETSDCTYHHILTFHILLIFSLIAHVLQETISVLCSGTQRQTSRTH